MTRLGKAIAVPGLLSILIGSAVAQNSSLAVAQGMSKKEAPAYPTKPIRFIVPFAPGGGTDTLARILAQRLSEAVAQPVVVDNRPGAGGVVGAEIAAKAPPDGYTLVLGSPGPLTINPNLRATMPYDTLRDFAPVTMATISPFTLVVHPSTPAHSVKELLALARAKPGQLNYGSAGNGSVSHFSAEQFKGLARVDLVHVPYKGAGPAVSDLVAGRLHLMFENLPTILPHVRSGRLRMLAVGTTSRSKLAPEIPTMQEAGVPGYESSTVFGVLFPARTPGAVVARMNGELVKILQSQEMTGRLAGQGLQAVGSAPREYAAHLKEELAKYGRIAKSAHIRIE